MNIVYYGAQNWEKKEIEILSIYKSLEFEKGSKITGKRILTWEIMRGILLSGEKENGLCILPQKNGQYIWNILSRDQYNLFKDKSLKNWFDFKKTFTWKMKKDLEGMKQVSILCIYRALENVLQEFLGWWTCWDLGRMGYSECGCSAPPSILLVLRSLLSACFWVKHISAGSREYPC